MPGDGKQRKLDDLYARAERTVSEPGEPAARLQAVCEMLQTAGLTYDWVGYYLVDRQEHEMLRLGPYAGEPTDHVSIPFGHGICGQAAHGGVTLVIADVTLESNYLSCSSHVRSEIVIPVYCGGTLVGELDLDSHLEDGFDDSDREFLEKIAVLTAADVARTGGFPV
jgi:putative methionine-R-sulfoxide reductase with GAF domain